MNYYSEERAMASVKNHPGKPIVEIPEIKEEFELGEKFYYTPDLMGEELTFEQLFGMIGELVFVMSDPEKDKPLTQQKAIVARVNSIVAYEGEIEDAVLDFDDGGKEPFFTLDSADFSEKYHGEMRSRAWRIKKTEEKELPAPKKKAVVSTVPIVSDSGTSLKLLMLKKDKKDIVSSLVHIGIQSVEELKERLTEVKAKFPPDWYGEITKALNIDENEADVAVPDFSEPVPDDEAMTMSAEEYEMLAAEKANEAVDNGLKWTAIGILFLAVGIKLMRDGKLYRKFDFKNFETYCKSKGISRQQGTKYADIGDMLEHRLKQEAGNENVKLLYILPEIEQRLNQSAENGKLLPILQKAGVEAGYLLTKLEDSVLDEVIQSVNPEETNGTDLKKTIREVEARHEKELEKLKGESEKALKAEKSKVESLERDKSRAYSELSKTEQRLIESRAREERLQREHAESIADYERQIQELENRPVEVMQSVEELQRIKELENQNELIANENSELEAENEALRRQLAEAQAQSVAVPLAATSSKTETEYRACLKAARKTAIDLKRCSSNYTLSSGLINGEEKKKLADFVAFLTDLSVKAIGGENDD